MTAPATLLCIAAALYTSGCNQPGSGGTANAAPAPGPVAAKVPPNGCKDAADSTTCVIARAQQVTALLQSLANLEGSKNPKARDVALSALRLPIPLIQEAALRVLAPFGAEATVAQAALPKLLGDVSALQRAAADVLAQAPAYNRMADLYRGNHPSGGKVDFLPRPTDVRRWGFAAPPGASGFPPGDGDRTVAIRVKKPLADVAAFYARGAVQTFSPGELVTYVMTKQQEASVSPAVMSEQIAKVQALMAEYQKTQDPKLLERVQQLSDETAKAQAALPKFNGEIYGAIYALTGRESDSVKIVVLERKGTIDTRIAYIYDDPELHETVVQLAWAESLGLPPRFGAH